jgi:hypothetical protein
MLMEEVQRLAAKSRVLHDQVGYVSNYPAASASDIWFHAQMNPSRIENYYVHSAWARVK